MDEHYQAVRQRIDQALNGNAGAKLTPELILGLFSVVDACFQHLILSVQSPLTKGGTEIEDEPASALGPAWMERRALREQMERESARAPNFGGTD